MTGGNCLAERNCRLAACATVSTWPNGTQQGGQRDDQQWSESSGQKRHAPRI